VVPLDAQLSPQGREALATAVARAAKIGMRAKIRMVCCWVEKSVGLKREWPVRCDSLTEGVSMMC
jgi:hypothetical protein